DLTWAEGTATQGCDRSADPGAGIPRGESPIQLASRSRNPGEKAINPRCARAAPSRSTKPFSLRCCRGLGAPASRAALEQVAVVEQAIQHGTHGGDIAQQFAPVLDRAVGSQQRAETFVAAHDNLQQILGGGVRELAHAEVVEDEQRYSRDR